jgi:hypothetical protein
MVHLGFAFVIKKRLDHHSAGQLIRGCSARCTHRLGRNRSVNVATGYPYIRLFEAYIAIG